MIWCLAVCLATGAWAQSIPSAPNSINKKGRKDGEWVERYDSTWGMLGANSTKVPAFYRKITYKDGVPKGPVRDYYVNGVLQMEGNYMADKSQNYKLVEDGEFKFYHPNGRLHTSGQMRQGSRIGVWPIQDEQGNKLHENDFGAKGEKNGWIHHHQAERLDLPPRRC